MKARKTSQPARTATTTPTSARRTEPNRAGLGAMARGLIPAVILAGAVALVFGRAARTPFFFDDRQAVLENPSITHLWPLVGDEVRPGPLRPSRDFCTAGRPLVNWSLAVNYRLGGIDPTGYHVVNMVVHALSALLLWLIVRGTLRQECFAGRYEQVAEPLALVAALIWALHPLQTETVVYTTQRTELMAGFFYLATIYASMRYWAAVSRGSQHIWLACATLACLLGMACKEIMATAPVMVLLYQRTFIDSSVRDALRRSWPLYVGMGLGWLLLLALNLGGPRAQTAGFHLGISATEWWFTQAKVLMMYLGLVIWPWPLTIHYEIPHIETVTAALPWLARVVILAGATLVLLWRRSAIGLALAGMFAILAPTLIVPIVTEVAVERRMYLPLAALVTLGTIGVYELSTYLGRALGFPAIGSRFAIATTVLLGAMAATAYTAVDVRRLADYRDAVSIWQSALAVYPNSTVIRKNLASELLLADRPAEALAESRETVALGLADHGVHNNLAAALQKLGERDGFQPGQIDEIVEHLHEALRLYPQFDDAYVNLAFALFTSQNSTEAIKQCETALSINPQNARAMCALATILSSLGRQQEAGGYFRQALEHDPTSPEAHYGLALLMLDQHHSDEAVQHLRTAIALNPRLPEAHYALGGVLAGRGEMQAAAGEYRMAIDLRPNYPRAINNLGVALMNLGRTDDAIRNFQEAVRLNPEYQDARNNLERAREAKKSPSTGTSGT